MCLFRCRRFMWKLPAHYFVVAVIVITNNDHETMQKVNWLVMFIALWIFFCFIFLFIFSFVFFFLFCFSHSSSNNDVEYSQSKRYWFWLIKRRDNFPKQCKPIWFFFIHWIYCIIFIVVVYYDADTCRRRTALRWRDWQKLRIKHISIGIGLFAPNNEILFDA